MPPPIEQSRMNYPESPFKDVLHGCDGSILQKLKPTIEMTNGLYSASVNILQQNKISPFDTFRYAREIVAPWERTDPNFLTKYELVAQHQHIIHTLETTLALKRYLIEKKLPERILVYQTGTGFPLPEENNTDFVHKGFLPFGKNILKHVPKSGVAGHTDDSGIHFYEVTGKDGNKITLLTLKGRYHGYEAVHRPYPHLELALMRRVLKGIGAESVLTTYASGFDTVPYLDESPPTMGDYGYILNAADLSRVTTLTHPGIGNQTIVGPMFGGPFKPGPTRTSDYRLISVFENTIGQTYPNGMYQYTPDHAQPSNKEIIRVPNRRPTLFYDGKSTPDFETAADWADARSNAKEILEQLNMFPRSTLALMPDQQFAIAHGMTAVDELATYYQDDPEE